MVLVISLYAIQVLIIFWYQIDIGTLTKKDINKAMVPFIGPLWLVYSKAE